MPLLSPANVTEVAETSPPSGLPKEKEEGEAGGWSYFGDVKVVRVGRVFLQDLNTQILPFRPSHRIHTSIDAENQHYALLCADQSVLSLPSNDGSPLLPNSFPPVSLEFKVNSLASPSSLILHHLPLRFLFSQLQPKWGFLPNPKFLSPETHLIKTRRCRYCLHQHLKLHESSISEISDYCPLDLYSGNKARIQGGIAAFTHFSWKFFTNPSSPPPQPFIPSLLSLKIT